MVPVDTALLLNASQRFSKESFHLRTLTDNAKTKPTGHEWKGGSDKNGKLFDDGRYDRRWNENRLFMFGSKVVAGPVVQENIDLVIVCHRCSTRPLVKRTDFFWKLLT